MPPPTSEARVGREYHGIKRMAMLGHVRSEERLLKGFILAMIKRLMPLYLASDTSHTLDVRTWEARCMLRVMMSTC